MSVCSCVRRLPIDRPQSWISLKSFAQARLPRAGGRRRADLIRPLEHEWMHVRDPRRLRRQERRRRRLPDAGCRGGIARHDRADRQPSVIDSSGDRVRCRRMADRDAGGLRDAVRHCREREISVARKQFGLQREEIGERFRCCRRDGRVGGSRHEHPDSRPDRSVAAEDRRDGVVDGPVRVGHVDQAFVLERTGADHDRLRDLVPLLRGVAGRQRARRGGGTRWRPGGADGGKRHDHRGHREREQSSPRRRAPAHNTCVACLFM